MEKTKAAFVVYGVHKDGLQDPMGAPFVDEDIVRKSREALEGAGLELAAHGVTIASKSEARECLGDLKKRDDVHAVVLFSGTWVWAAHLVAAIRDHAASGKAVVVWTHPGSQGWRPVGGLVLHGGLKEIGVPHRFVYGAHDDETQVRRVASYCRAAHLRSRMNMTTAGVFGGRGMGQTCGVADPAQWMRVFGIDIDSRDSFELIQMAEECSEREVAGLRARMQPSFTVPVPENEVADRSIRLLAAIQKFLNREGWDYYTIQSFPGIADGYSATCLAQSMMLEWGVPTSTLSDFNTLLSVILLTNLSEERVYYGDLQHLDLAKREVKIIGDGACPPSLAGRQGPARFGEHGIPTEGEAGGLSVDLVCKPGRGVLARAGRTGGEFEMVLARCEVFEPQAEAIRERREECGIPFWPHAFVYVEGDIEGLAQAWNNEYAVLGYGESLFDEVSDFCEQAGIRLITP